MFGLIKRIKLRTGVKNQGLVSQRLSVGTWFLMLLAIFVLLGTPQTVSASVTPQPKEDVKTETSQVRVVKIWEDEGNEAKRPKQIEVQLRRGDTVVETVVLSQTNNWQYQWSNLEEDSNWKVQEVFVSDDYVTSVEQKNDTYYITNTYVGAPGTSDEKLPQTGILWWPVPVLTVGGMVCCVGGWMLLQRRVK